MIWHFFKVPIGDIGPQCFKTETEENIEDNSRSLSLRFAFKEELIKPRSDLVVKLYLFQYTMFSRIEAAASICFLYFLVQFLLQGGFYSRAASIYRNSLSVIRQMALFRNFFSRVGL